MYLRKYILIMAQNTRSSMLISHIYELIFTIFLITTVRSNVINYPCIEEATKNHEVEEYNKPSSVTFKDIVSEIGISKKQCKIRTSPNCLFPQYDNKLKRWDKGCFCMEETLSGGACVGDANGDGFDDLYYPRLDGSDILYLIDKNGQLEDHTKESNLFFSDIKSNGCHFVDIDNDGDNDIYISTLGDERFYLFVNDGTGKFTEEAVERGLGNEKHGLDK